MSLKKKDSKKPKKKTLLRNEIIFPLLIFFLIVFVYFSFFFDHHVKNIIEKMSSSLYGAEVNIGRVETSFLKGSFSIENLEITNKEKPNYNLVQIKSIKGGVVLDALLRFKFVIREASIEKVEFHQRRKKPGKIFPPSSSKQNKLFFKFQKTAFHKLKKEEKGNLLGDLASILTSVSYKGKGRIQDLGNFLKSKAHLSGLETDLKKIEQKWKIETKKILSKEEWENWLKTHKSKLKASLKNPKDYFSFSNKVRLLIRETKEKAALIRRLKNEFDRDQSLFKESFQNLGEKIKEDERALSRRFRFPSFDVQDFSKGLFLGILYSNLEPIFQYIDLLKKYLPQKRNLSSSKESFKKQIREKRRKKTQGRTHHFPFLNSYPFFWLKKANLSSEFLLSSSNKDTRRRRKGERENKESFLRTKDDQRRSFFKGQILNLSSHPALLKSPMNIHLECDFPEFEIRQPLFEMIVDHRRNENPSEKVEFNVDSFPLPTLIFSQHKNLLWEIKNSRSRLAMRLSFENEMFQAHIKQSFFQVQHHIESKSEILKRILKNILLDFQEFEIKASFYGPYKERQKWKTKISSRFGSFFSRRLKMEIKKEIQKAKLHLKEKIKNQISLQKRQVLKKIRKLEQEILMKFKMGENEVDLIQNEINKWAEGKKKSIDQIYKQKFKKETQKLKKKGKKLLKKFRF